MSILYRGQVERVWQKPTVYFTSKKQNSNSKINYASGDWEEENTYKIEDYDGNTLIEGSPTSGLLLTFDVLSSTYFGTDVDDNDAESP